MMAAAGQSTLEVSVASAKGAETCQACGCGMYLGEPGAEPEEACSRARMTAAALKRSSALRCAAASAAWNGSSHSAGGQNGLLTSLSYSSRSSLGAHSDSSLLAASADTPVSAVCASSAGRCVGRSPRCAGRLAPHGWQAGGSTDACWQSALAAAKAPTLKKISAVPSGSHLWVLMQWKAPLGFQQRRLEATT